METVDCLALIEAARSGAEDALAGRNFALDGDATVGVVTRRGELPTEARLFTIEAVEQGVYGDANFAERATILPITDAI